MIQNCIKIEWKGFLHVSWLLFISNYFLRECQVEQQRGEECVCEHVGNVGVQRNWSGDGASARVSDGS